VKKHSRAAKPGARAKEGRGNGASPLAQTQGGGGNDKIRSWSKKNLRGRAGRLVKKGPREMLGRFPFF